MLSADGRFFAFFSPATNLVLGDTNGFAFDVFVRDRQAGTTQLVSVSSAGSQGNGPSSRPAISANGRYVTFDSAATDLVAGDINNTNDVFVRDRQMGTTQLVSVSSGGVQGNGNSILPALSPDGRFVAFQSDASDLVAGDTNGASTVCPRPANGHNPAGQCQLGRRTGQLEQLQLQHSTFVKRALRHL